MKNLGVTLDSYLSFEKHVDHIFQRMFLKPKSTTFLYSIRGRLLHFWYHSFLFSKESASSFFLSIATCIPSFHRVYGRPHFLLLYGIYSKHFFDNLRSSILVICSYHYSCLSSILFHRVFSTLNLSLIVSIYGLRR